jgi:hypothetical protein
MEKSPDAVSGRPELIGFRPFPGFEISVRLAPTAQVNAKRFGFFAESLEARDLHPDITPESAFYWNV